MQDRTADVEASGFTDHVLVCTNARDGEYAACADAHGDAVHDAVTSWLRERDAYWSTVRVAETSCLGLCSAAGTAIAIQPRNRWYSDVTPEDVPDLMRDEFGANAERLGCDPATADSTAD